MTRLFTKTVALIVAHPDDETLWAGGTILCHPSWKCFVVCLCRANDEKRAPGFYNALKILKSEGIMGDLDDEPDLQPLPEQEMEAAILKLLPPMHFDLIISHSPGGEYTRHLRHEETGKAVIQLWHAGKISARALWTFAYEDGNKRYHPRAVEDAGLRRVLSSRIWRIKHDIITNTYGFKLNSWEAQTTPKTEAFRQFQTPADAMKWLGNLLSETI